MSPSTVTRRARLLGFPDKSSRASNTDWKAVRADYEAGHTIDECRARFGFTYGAWDKAVSRGDVVARPRRNRELSHATRDDVEQLLAVGLTQAAIARELGLTKSTVAYHARALGLRAGVRILGSLAATTGRRSSERSTRRVFRCEGVSRASV